MAYIKFNLHDDISKVTDCVFTILRKDGTSTKMQSMDKPSILELRKTALFALDKLLGSDDEFYIVYEPDKDGFEVPISVQRDKLVVLIYVEYPEMELEERVYEELVKRDE